MNTGKLTESEKLTLFLDGELDPTLENEVLESINQSEELQVQYAQEYAINSTVRAKGETAPPPFLKDEIFAELGYTSKPVATIPFFNWRNIWIAAGLLLITGVSIVLFNMNRTEDFAGNDQSNIEANKTANVLNTLKAKSINNDNNCENATVNKGSETAMTTITKVETNNSKSKNSKKSNTAKVNNTSNSSVSDYGDSADTDMPEIFTSVGQAIASEPESPFINTLFASTMKGVSTNIIDFSNMIDNAFNLTNNSSILPTFRINDGFKNEIRVKGMNFFAPTNMMTNGGLAVSYMRTLDYKIKVGLELGIENIDKVTYNTTTETIGTPKNVFASSLSAVARYEMKDLSLYNCHLFIQAQGGIGLNANYVYGGCAGIQYTNYYTPFAVQLSYDYKAFNYYYGGTSANSEKFEKQGFAIGLIYKF